MLATIPAKRKFGNINTVTLFVGPSRTAFHIHEDTICSASPVFKAAFESRFKEGTERTMELPDEDDGLFDHFVGWLYGRNINHKVFETAAPDVFQGHMMLTARLFVLADKYDVEALQVNICKSLFRTAAHATNNSLALGYDKYRESV